MRVWAAISLISSGLFTGGVFTIVWDRLSAWRAMTLPQFMTDFRHTTQRADKIQPALLVVSIVTDIGFGVTAIGTARILAFIGAAGFFVVLIASIRVLVPLQRRILQTGRDETRAIELMQGRWFSGHLGRSALSVASFILTAMAVSLSVSK